MTKEFRELFVSRAFWIMLVIVGALVGHAFITAVGLYAEMSGAGGGPAALAQGLTPLDGVLVPTWGAYDLAATLLFPFVAIRLIAVEKETGALKLLLQLPGTLGVKVATKGVVLICAWLIAWIPGLAILFNLKPNGDYLTVRFNGKEDNVVLWTFVKGKRSFVKKGTENVPLQMNTWHSLEIDVHGTTLQASLDGKHLLDYTLAEAVSGRVGVWSKTDSVSYFDQYTVTK